MGSGDSSVSVVNLLTDARPRNRGSIAKRDRIWLCSPGPPNRVWGHNQTAVFTGAIRLSAAHLVGCEANHSSHAVSSLKMELKFTTAHAFMLCAGNLSYIHLFIRQQIYCGMQNTEYTSHTAFSNVILRVRLCKFHLIFLCPEQHGHSAQIP